MSPFYRSGAYETNRATDAAAMSAKHNAARNRDEIRRLERQVDRMALANQALWELLKEWGGFTDEHILARMEEIDARDGKVDEQMGITIYTCPGCGRKTNTTRDACIFCGQELPNRHVFG